ncbi:MAG TPA: 16S rRNA (guanine(966)-N(2))-methyltransferase RsmD [Alphaproteobacteria bacterium]
MRITGGAWRSRVLQVPQDQTITRPTMDQTRLAVFNILNSADWALQENGQSLVMNGTILDVFAGTGSYGFEALSRGAIFATFMEKDFKAVQAMQKTAETLKCTSQTKIMRTDALKTISNPQAPVTICFIDPPYGDETWPDVIKHLKAQGWIDANTLIVLEANSKMSREALALAETHLILHDNRRYGHALVIFGNLSI